MSDVYTVHEGDSPLLISVPHDGWRIPADLIDSMSEAGRGIPDTDWHVRELYEFAAAEGASMIAANYTRYVVDLNRPADDAAMYGDQLATGLCPLQTFAGEDIYRDAAHIDRQQRIARYWQPYHDRLRETLDSIRERHGYALLWDAHSIASEVPRLFDQRLPVLNVGTWDGRSCAASLADAVMDIARQSPYEAVINERFKGGHITRHYGAPAEDIHAVQLELAQRAYMDERTLEFDRNAAGKLRDTLKRMLDAYRDAAAHAQKTQ